MYRFSPVRNKNKIEIDLLHLHAAVQLLKRPPSRVIMVRTKEDAQAAPKRAKGKGAVHDATVSAARAKDAQKKKEQKKVPSDEEDELDGHDEDRGEDSSSSSESQHAEKQDAIERAHDKSKTLAKEQSTEVNLQLQIDRQKKVNDKKLRELAKTRYSYPSEDEVHNLKHKYWNYH